MVTEYSQEFLHSITTGGLPPHELRLRKGALVMLLRNYAPHKGLCNGTRVVVDRIRRHLLIVRIVTGPYRGNIEPIPRICCDSSGEHELPFILRRHQFPVKPAWCMTINKSQGQTVSQRLGIYLPTPVFAHGQLYVAFSRATKAESVRVYVEDHDSKRRVCEDGSAMTVYTTNIVDRALLMASSAPQPEDSDHLDSIPPHQKQQTAQLDADYDLAYDGWGAEDVNNTETYLDLDAGGIEDARMSVTEMKAQDMAATLHYARNPYGYDEWCQGDAQQCNDVIPYVPPQLYLDQLDVDDTADPTQEVNAEPTHIDSNYAWGCRYFERQVDARCGRHAINNVLGGPQFTNEDLHTACQQVLAITGEDAVEHEKEGGWYSHSVISVALDALVPPTCRLLASPLSNESYQQVFLNQDILGALVNEDQHHWSAILRHADCLWHVDSRSRPELLTEQGFRLLVQRFPATMAVVSNEYME